MGGLIWTKLDSLSPTILHVSLCDCKLEAKRNRINVTVASPLVTCWKMFSPKGSVNKLTNGIARHPPPLHSTVLCTAALLTTPQWLKFPHPYLHSCLQCPLIFEQESVTPHHLLISAFVTRFAAIPPMPQPHENTAPTPTLPTGSSLKCGARLHYGGIHLRFHLEFVSLAWLLTTNTKVGGRRTSGTIRETASPKRIIFHTESPRIAKHRNNAPSFEKCCERTEIHQKFIQICKTKAKS